MTISRCILLRTKTVSNKQLQRKNTFYVQQIFFPENRPVYEIMSKNVVEPDRSLMTIWRRVACWMSRATRALAYVRANASTHTDARMHAHTEKSVILIAFPQQTMSRDRASVLS